MAKEKKPVKKKPAKKPVVVEGAGCSTETLPKGPSESV